MTLSCSSCFAASTVVASAAFASEVAEGPSISRFVVVVLMITVVSSLRSRPVRLEAIEDLMRSLRAATGHQRYAVGVQLLGVRAMRDANSQLRGKDKVTDVLSIPAQDWAAPLTLSSAPVEAPDDLGDILLCVPHVLAQKHHVDHNDRLQLLLTHSYLHLLGYTHDEDADHEVMEAQERHLMQTIGRVQLMT